MKEEKKGTVDGLWSKRQCCGEEEEVEGMHDHGNDSGRNHPFNCSSGDRSTSHCLVSARSWTREILLHSSLHSFIGSGLDSLQCMYLPR